jgi:outer membrane receptor protein involved in Fe transport
LRAPIEAQMLPVSIPRIRRPTAILLPVALVLFAAGPGRAAPDTMDEIVVTSQRRAQPLFEHAGNIARLDAATLDAVQHQHVHELLTRVSGVWLSRGSGQEHLTAIRSPVLTGAGSCGAFLFLEDGIPIRPTGFCNVNALFEVDTEQARAVEVVRGPGNALYGSNALHGIVNVLMPEPLTARAPQLALEAGANDYLRGRLELPFNAAAPWLAALVHADDGGFRDDTGYVQTKLHVKRLWTLGNGEFTGALTVTDLDQETAGFIIGEDAYRDDQLKRSNPNPEAFREARSLRAYGIWRRQAGRFDLDVRPYVRHTSMEFLQHFLPGKPLEENGHDSAGLLAALRFGRDGRETIVGIDAEWADMYLEETQDQPTEGSPFLQETRPVGRHYDYTVTSLGIAPYVQSEFALGERLTLGAGLRVEYIRYDYDNRMLAGNTRDDGSECGFGGCLYTRPADRDDGFTNAAPKLSLDYRLDSATNLYAVLARGFRAPQATELYRLQSGQQVADLDPESVDSFELGIRRRGDSFLADVAVYAMNKRDSVFRDAEGFNVSGARTKHRGVEIGLDWRLSPALELSLAATYARHYYDFDTVAALGETFRRGREVDTAPRVLGNLELNYAPRDGVDVGMQLTSIGDYYVDAENRFEYPGHVIGNLRTAFRIGDELRLTLRLNNVMDRDIADRADYAFGNFRYFPGRGREFFAELQYSPRSESE